MKINVSNMTPIAEGGEGCIYDYNGRIIKVFKPHINLSVKECKIDTLMSVNLPQYVIKPLEKVYDMNGKFIGYLMNKADGDEFKRLTNKKFCTSNNIDTKFCLDILIRVKKTIDKLHEQKIYIGDLNDQNILFNTSGNIYFLDCDSWSVGNNNCTVAMDLFKDPELVSDNFNEKTDNYAFMVLAWKSLTRVHPFGGTMDPDIPIADRISKKISVIDRNDIKLPRTTKTWNGFSPDLVTEFKKVFESNFRTITDNLEDMYNNLAYCKKDKEYYYNKFSSCPYCNSGAKVNLKPQSHGLIGGLKLVSLFDETRIKAIFDRHTFLDVTDNVCNGNNNIPYKPGVRYYFLNNQCWIEDYEDYFYIHSDKEYTINKKYKTMIEVFDNNIYYISPSNSLTQIQVLNGGNAIKNICKVANNSYFAINNGQYCIINYYDGKIVVNINGTYIEVEYNSDIQNYGIHMDVVSKKWLVILEDGSGTFRTFVFNNNNIEYQTDKIKYECSLNNPCINSSIIFIPIDGKIRGFAYIKSAFKDFECNIVSEESKLIKENSRFVIINTENVYYLGK